MSESFENLGFDPATALPRSNGELVFSEPWESRAFGMAAALADDGVFNWSDFQAGLIAVIAEREKSGDSEEVYQYYERWLSTREGLVTTRGLVSTEDIDTRVAEFLCRPKGHDHHQDHDGHSHSH